jgi:ATP/maltotriose-dependent transcriptional regulator MalT
LRTAQLRLTPADSAALLARAGIELSAANAATLVGRTEGWIGGLHLAARSLAGAIDPERVAADIVGYDAGITDRVAGHPSTYRLHLLLAETLRAELARDAAHRSRLIARAVQWLADHERLVDAVQTAQLDRAWARAESLLIQCAPMLTVRGHSSIVRSLINRFPIDVVLSRPELSATAVSSNVFDGDLTNLHTLTRAAVAGAAALQPERARRIYYIEAMAEAVTNRIDGDFEHMLGAMTRVEEIIGLSDRPGTLADDARRATMSSNFGTALLWLGQTDEARVSLERGARQARDCGAEQPLLNCMSL